jgi:hypothetical protein
MAELTLCDAEGLAETFHWPMDVAPLRRAGADRLRFRFWSAIRQEALRRGGLPGYSPPAPRTVA